MVLKKNTWVSLLLGCFSNKNQSLEPRNTEIMSPNYSRRLSLSDISNPGSSLELLNSHLSSSLIGSNLHIFTLQELKLITQNFSLSNYLGQGGFGQVHRGFIGDNLRPGLEAQSVAVKVLDLDGTQGHMEWLTEVLMLGQLRHPHLVKLIGYCCEDEQRLLVYEYLPRGNLDSLIFKGYHAPLPWLTRIKIAVGAAKGLAFLHEEEKPVIYRDFKASNILLDSDLNAKLSDFGLAMDGPEGEETYVSTCVMGTEGYAAPEYIKTGHLTTMSDVYSFGVVLLELLTGRRSMDKRRPNREQNLVAWARPLLKTPQRLEKIIDPRLEGQYSTEGSKRAATLAYQCLNQHSKSRPTMSNVVKTLEPLLDLDDIPVGPFVYVFPSERDAQRNLKKNSEEKEVESKENGQEGHRNGSKRRHRKRSMRSRAVHSDTALYKTLGTSLYSPKQSESTRH